IGSLALLSSTEVNPRYYRTQYLVALALIALATVAAPLGLARLFDETLATIAFSFALRGILPMAAILCCFGSFSWSIEGHPASRLFGIGSAALLIMALSFKAAVSVEQLRSMDFPIMLAGEFTSSALLGTAVTAMLLGHFYLIAPGMSLAPLMRLLTALFAA